MGFGHICLDTATEYASTLRSVWSEPTETQCRPATSVSSTTSISPEPSDPRTWAVSSVVIISGPTR